MKTIATAFASGLVFGLGLVVSQMVNPAKVQNFLDVFGRWDPSLAFVMLAAIPVAGLGFAVATRLRRPLVAPQFRLPSARSVDQSLIAGAVLFGIGWGLVGYCPGPAVTALGIGQPQALMFVVAMFAGMGLYELVQSIGRRQSTSEA